MQSEPDYSSYRGEQMAMSGPRILDNITDLASRVEETAAVMQAFLDRFHGHGPEKDTMDPRAVAAVPSGHVGQIERLTVAINRVDGLAREIAAIG